MPLRLLLVLALLAVGGLVAATLLGRDHHAARAPVPTTAPVRRAPPPTHRTQRLSQLARLARLGLPVYCGGGRGRYVALTFDDGPGTYTGRALRILRAARARATFFLVGRNLATWPGFVRREAALGGLGDHTWTHPYLPALGDAATRRQLGDTQRAIERSSGTRVRLFRPPYGVRTRASDATARRLGMLDVMWSVDSFDWKGAGWRQIAANVVRGLRPGSIVLLHENHGQTIRALKFLLLPELRARRWKLVSVTELLALDPPSPRQLVEGLRGCLRRRARSSG